MAVWPSGFSVPPASAPPGVSAVPCPCHKLDVYGSRTGGWMGIYLPDSVHIFPFHNATTRADGNVCGEVGGTPPAKSVRA